MEKGDSRARTALVVRLGARTIALATLIAATCAPAGCGGRTATELPDLLAADFPAAAGRASCANMEHCCRAANLGFDEAHCREVVTATFASFDWSLLPGPIPGSRKCLDSLAASADSCTDGVGCNDAIGNLSAEPKGRGEACNSTCTRITDVGAGCGDFTGSGPTSVRNQGCFTNDGLFCDSTSGTCQARPSRGEGSSCAILGDSCDMGFRCVASSGPCVSRPGQGPPCHCTALKGEGGPCTATGDCAFGTCKDGICTDRKPLTEAALKMLCQ